MKLTKSRLKQIIKEELKEGYLSGTEEEDPGDQHVGSIPVTDVENMHISSNGNFHCTVYLDSPHEDEFATEIHGKLLPGSVEELQDELGILPPTPKL